MLTIPNAVEEVIKKKPFLEGALVEGLINLSALARQLKPEIEKQVGKAVNDSAVIMALNRLVPRLELMSAMILACEPRPSATTDTTEAMPMMIPSIVKKPLNLLFESAFSAIFIRFL